MDSLASPRHGLENDRAAPLWVGVKRMSVVFPAQWP